MTAGGEAAAEGVRPDGLVEPEAPAPLVVRRRGRRVTTGAEGAPTGEPAPEPQQSTENDARLEGDRPPHWG